MFRKNNGHLQEDLFTSYTNLHPKIKTMLQKSWAPIYYEHVFSQIDESKFAKIYCSDNGRPNFPVNILLSLEFIKHLNDYTDEQILEMINYSVYSKSTAAAPGDYPKQRGARAAFYSACRYADLLK